MTNGNEHHKVISSGSNPCTDRLTDIEYLEHMIPHHQVAIDMSNMLIPHTNNAEILHLCRNIIRKQSYEIWERNGQVGDGKNTNFFIINHFKFNNKKKFIENNRLWGSLVVKPQLEKTKGLSWGCATILSSSSGEDGKMKSFNGMSWDGYNSLNEILNNFSYNEDNSWDNKYFKTFMKEIKDKDLTKFANAKHSEIYELIDSSFN